MLYRAGIAEGAGTVAVTRTAGTGSDKWRGSDSGRDSGRAGNRRAATRAGNRRAATRTDSDKDGIGQRVAGWGPSIVPIFRHIL